MRTAEIKRKTKETDISLKLTLEGGDRKIDTGIGFFDHMLNSFAVHSGFGLTLTCKGDLEVDGHHSVEDCGIALGQALAQCVGDKAGIARFGQAFVPMDEALVMAAVLLRGSEERSDRSIFLFGFVMGGAYEYICSAVGELLFGVIFWDYSGFKFNLGGRVNLLYCFFWGIAAVVWIRYGYPLVAKLMANLKKHILPWMTVVLTVFMAVNMGLSALALARYDARTSGIAPANQLDVFLDEHFDNARMERVYPNAKKTG